MLRTSRPVIRRLSETRDASLPESHADNASPNAATEISAPATISSPARGVPSSSRNSGMIGPKVRSAMFTKNRIISAVKYSGRFQNPDADGSVELSCGGFSISASLYKSRMLSRDTKFMMPVTMNVFRTPIDVARIPPKNGPIAALRICTD